ERRGERPDLPPLEPLERPGRVLVACPHGEALGCDVVAARELADLLLLLRRLDPVDRDLEVAPRDEVEELGVVSLDEGRLRAELLRERRGELDLEADPPVRVAR